MQINSRAVALMLATVIAAVTLAFTSLVEGATTSILFVTTLISFGASYILSQITLDYLIFREINKIYAVLNELKKEHYGVSTTSDESHLNPLRGINKEIANYAQYKEQEIKELKRLETFRREFLADISHELKTPIFAAQGFVHTLLDGAAKDKTVRKKFLKKAAKSLDGLNMLVQDLLTISQMEIGEVRMHPDHFNLNEVVQDVLEQLEDKAERKQIKVLLSEDTPEKVFCYADQQRIFQVMINLVGNAIKYTQENGSVLIRMEIKNAVITVSVKDNGPGIALEHLKRIFERFYRVEKSRSKDKGGTGLGLAIVKHILEAHDTQVQVASEIGEGTTFSFQLPLGDSVELDPLFEEENFLEADH